ncbi:hypothetical protein ACI3PL_31580, partial [Lacticaseibacillus paracasei]
MTAAILTNPLIIAAATIAAGVYLVVKATEELNKELSFLSSKQDDMRTSTGNAVKSLSIFEKAWNGVLSVL